MVEVDIERNGSESPQRVRQISLGREKRLMLVASRVYCSVEQNAMSKFPRQILPCIAAKMVPQERTGNPARTGSGENTMGQEIHAKPLKKTLRERSLRDLLCFCHEVVGIMHACLPWHCIP